MAEKEPQKDPSPRLTVGGSGGLLKKPDNVVSDLELIERFPFRPDANRELAEMVQNLALDPKQRTRVKLAATKAWLAMEKLNFDYTKLGTSQEPTEPQQHLHLHAGANGERNGDGIDWTKQPPEVVFEAMKLAARARQISANGNGKVVDVKPENGDRKP